MQFAHTYKQVMDGTKGMTRRLVEAGDISYHSGFPTHVAPITFIERGGRVKWQVGNTYAVQPGRTKKAIGRIRITGIRQERLQSINHHDVRAETGDMNPYHYETLEDFIGLWDSFHTKPGTRWLDNPLVWVLEFEVVEKVNEEEWL